MPGSVADKAQTAAVTDLNADSADVNETVTYTKVGSLVPSSSDGNFPGAPTVVYPNDPSDATKVTPAGVPTVPGYTAHDPEGHVLTPGSSYQPSDPTKDTTITYTADKQKGSVSYVDDTTGKTLKTDSISGTTGSKSSYSTSGSIADYKKQGYELVTDGYPADLTFDNDDTTDQNFTVHLKHRLTPVNPTDPQTPGTPINPDEPDGPKWPTSTNYDKTVNETVSYVDQNGHEVAKQHTDSVNFTRTVVVDNVTGEVITSGAGTTAWTATNGDTTFDAVVSPVVPGSVADKAQTAAVTDLNADSADVNETVTYTKVGSLVPSSSDGNFPGAPTVVYPNDPSDATKVTPAGVPTVPGYTAHDPEGHVLTPGSSYQPSDPTKDTTITYTADKQKGSVSYVDDTTGKTLKTDSISGTTGSKSSYSTSGSIADYKKQGYELVTDGYPADLTFDNDDTTDQNFTVHLKHRLTPVNPTDPQTPGTPINPDEPDGPKWPTSTNYDKTVNETISYVDQNGHVVAKQHTDSVNFTRTVVVDNVTGEVITSGAGTTAWTATNGDTTFDAVVSPVVPGSVADKAQTAAVTDLNADSADVNETVTYTKVGSLVPSSSDGNFPGAPTVVYPNDPSDATKVTPAGVPTVPGYTAHDPEGHVLTPGSSYQPSDPTKDTTITYTADKQKGSVSYVDDTTGKTLKTDSISGTTGSKSSYSTSGNIADYKKQGYELVTDGYPADLTFDNDDTTDQNFTVHLKHQLTPVNPTDPQTPGAPINPDEPDGPKWPTSTNYDKTVNETVSYVDQNGHVVAKPHTDSVNFTRTVVVDNVTGEVITSGAGTTAWTATNGDTTFDAVVSPVVPGSVADKAQTAAVTDLNADSADVNETVTYTKVGSLVPSSSDGNFPGAPTVVYPNDPSDATKVTPAGVPTVPGYTAHDPEGHVLTPGSSYQPSDPTKDTTITYTADKQKGSVSYVDDTTGKTLKTDSISGTTGSKSSYSTSGNIADYKKQGYELVTDGYPADLTFDNDDTTDQNFTVHLKHQLTPVNPTDPQTPGAPINPDEPDGPKWPTSTNYDKTVNETVSYVDQNGHEVAKQHTDSVNFTRTVVVDNVTGEVITSGAGTTAWTATNGDTTFDAVVSPVVPGSVADKAQTAAVTDLNADSADVNETVTYTKVGSLVPSSSDGNFPGAPTVVYPNDPSDATKVTPAGVPTVPGYTAHDPEGHVLTPGSSYQPSDPTKDTTITYTADKQQGSVSYVDDTTGKTLKTDSISGTTGSKSSYSTSGNIADYKKQGYELVTDGYPADLTFDNDDTTDQNFTVHLKHRLTPVNPTDPQTPGTPINPDEPDGPKWPTSTNYDKTVNETISYVDQNGHVVAKQHTDSVNFTRTVVVDNVTGEVITSGAGTTAWTATNGDTTFDAVVSPVVPGSVADKAQTAAVTDLNADSADVNETVTYTKVGSLVPSSSDGNFPGAPTVVYPNDPSDATKVTPAGVPTVPGYTAHDPEGYVLTPGSSYQPSDPTKDTTITYTADKQKGSVSYVDDTTGKTLKTDSISGTTGSKSSYSTSGNIADYKKQGYELVTDGYPADLTFDNDDTTDQNFTVHLKHQLTPVNPTDPQTPGAPINPDEPDGPKWPTSTNYDKTVNETVSYVDQNGHEVAKQHTDSVNFTRTVVVDNVTGEVITSGAGTTAWTATNGDTTFDAVVSPVVPGSVADKAQTAAVTDLNADSADVNETVTYTKVGSLVPSSSDGNFPGAPTVVYPNDPSDATKVTPAGVPTVPGYTAHDPEGYVLTPGSSYQPSDPTKDTTITYTADKQKGSVSYVDDTTGKTLKTDSISGTTGSKSSYSTSGNIADYKKQGYELVTDGYPADLTFDNDDTTDQNFTVHLKHQLTPVNPTDPQTPGAPINPDEPDGPKWPTSTNYDKTVNETVSYVDQNGHEVAKQHTDSVNFTRTVVVDNVTGEVITSGAGTTAWTATNGDTTFDAVVSPVVPGSVADKAQTAAVTDLNADSADVNETVTYTKVGSLVPSSSDGNFPGARPVVYPNDPSDATKVTPAGVPTVPGYTAHDPEGHVLTPGSSYQPSDPTKDTTITYTADKQQGSVSYVDDTTGKTLKTDSISGTTGSKSSYSTSGSIADYKKQGYELVTDGYPADLTFDNDDTTDQNFTVHLKHQLTPVNPTDPQTPGAPINPDEPDGPKWPASTNYDKTVNETVSYVDQNGHVVAKQHTDSVNFTRTVVVDNVTGEVITSGDGTTAWTATNGDTTFDAVVSPVVPGSVADKAQTAAVTDLNADSANVNETVTYTKVGSLVPSSSDGNFPGARPVVYPNDPSDATKVTPAGVPTVAGYTAHDPEGHVLTPGSSYQPSDPTKDTTITYTADKQQGSVSYVDDTTGETLKTDSISGTTGSKSSYSTSGSIADYKKQGYELVTDGYPADLTFDNDDTTDQNFTVHLKHQLTPVNPTDPQTPGAPINPDEPDGPKWPTSTNYDKTVNETVSYVDQNGHVVAKQHTDSVNFTRTVVVDNVTGEVITSGDGTTAWTATNGDTTFDAVVSPVVPGSVADKAQTAAVTDLNADSADVNETVTYTKVGSLVPSSSDGNFPGAPTVVYPNDPSDATKVTPAGVPTVPGYTAHDPEGHVLTPGSSYQPSDPTKDTTITYTADKQKGSVSYVDDTTGKTLKTDSISGTTGSKSSYSTSGSIADYKKQGYELVTDGYPADLTFDNDDTTDQNFTVHLKHQLTPVNPTDPQTPGAPINPDEPDGPKWPASTNYDKTVNETVSYVDQNGHGVAKQHTDSVNFTRTVVVDNVTGEVITSGAGTTAWTATNGDTTFDAVVSPVVPGSVADKAQTAAVTDLNADSADVNETVTYTKVGSLVPSSSDGNFPGAPTVVYPNDPSDATKVTPAGVPTVPGYTAHDPEGHVLTPGSSYQPSDPTKDTTITYTADKQQGSVSYVDDTTGKTLKTDSISGTTGSKSSYSTSGSIADYKKQGYELVTDGYPADLTFDNDDTTDQNFTVHLKHRLTPVNPTDPQTPGTPINPDEPDGPKWPTSTNYDKTVNETISYVDQNGHVVAKQHTDSVNFTRTVVVDNVTGEVITSGAGTTAWTATNGDTTFDAVVSPVASGSVADKAQTAAVTDLNADSADVNETVTYTKVGSLVPSSSDGNFPGARPVVYPNDPSDATKVTPADVPTVPGYTAHDPEGHVLTPGSSYQPSDPTKDTTITYTADKQQGSVSYVDDTTGKTLKTDSISGTTGSKSSYSTSGSIADYKKQGYELVTDGYPADLTFDNDDTTDQNFTVHLKHRLTPVNPTDPQTPGTPINPDEPDGPKWPTSTNYDKTVNETISYVDQNGHVVAKQHTDSVNFTRTVVVDNVTGEVITSGAGTTAWTATNGDTTFDAVVSPVVPGSVADKAQTAAVTDLNADSADVNETVTYTKVGSLVPSSSDGNFPGAPTVVYPNDPSDATKVTPAGVPTVPGYTAHDPEGHVLTPGSSYQPSDPTKDTTITYTADKQKGSVSYVDDTTGKTLKTDSISGTTGSKSSYSTSGNIADYKKQGYELVTDGYPADLTFDNDDTTDQNFTVHLKHQNIQSTEAKTVTETIHYQGAGNQTPADNTAQVTFTRQVSTDTVTGEKTYGSWSAGQSFAAVTSPVIKGYTPDQAEIGAQTVSGDASDLDFTVIYTKDAPTKPVNPSQPTTPAKPVQAGQAAATNFVDQRLPQTGETDQQHMTLSGLLLLAMSSVLGLFGMTKRQRKE
ncbi:mucin-binding protein [Paucilactobacillus nenjiangensis]